MQFMSALSFARAYRIKRRELFQHVRNFSKTEANNTTHILCMCETSN